MAPEPTALWPGSGDQARRSGYYEYTDAHSAGYRHQGAPPWSDVTHQADADPEHGNGNGFMFSADAAFRAPGPDGRSYVAMVKHPLFYSWIAAGKKPGSQDQRECAGQPGQDQPGDANNQK